MESKKLRFGEFIAKKRADQGITLRKMAEEMGITAPYLSDIEKGRRNPPEMQIFLKMASILNIFGSEKNLMFDLAGKDRSEVSPDLPDYIMSSQIIRDVLRKAREVATEEDWRQFLRILTEKEKLN